MNRKTMTVPSMFQQLSPLTVGFDTLFKDFENFSNLVPQSYPPHNIVKVSDVEFRLEFAVAGISKDDITIKEESGYLIITGDTQNDTLGEGESYEYRGISARGFSKRFRLAEHMEIKGASMADGLLKISIKKEIPEKDLPKQIPIL